MAFIGSSNLSSTHRNHILPQTFRSFYPVLLKVRNDSHIGWTLPVEGVQWIIIWLCSSFSAALVAFAASAAPE